MSELHVVFGAGGGAGNALVRALVAQGERVRAVTRSGHAAVPPGVENVRADAADPAPALLASQGAQVIYHCVNVPYAEWEQTLPAVLENLLQAAETEGATLVYCDNLYMYGRVGGPTTEATAEAAASGKGKLRGRLANQVLEAHAGGRVRATVGRASDFFGPGATNTIAGQLIFPAVVAGERAHWIGSLDAPHSLNYIEDVARALMTLGEDPRAPGEVWHIPAGPPVTGREFIEMAFEVVGHPPKIGVYPRWMMWFAGLFDRQKREILEVLHQFEQPFILDGQKFTRTFGFEVTPLRDAIAATLEWERTRAASTG